MVIYLYVFVEWLYAQGTINVWILANITCLLRVTLTVEQSHTQADIDSDFIIASHYKRPIILIN